MNNRIRSINDAIKKEIAVMIDSEIKDPRLKAMTSVLKVDTTIDLKTSKVYVTIFTKDEELKKETLLALQSASGFIRKEIARRINLRITPEFTFVLDNSLDYVDKIEQLLKEAKVEKENE